jgi:hypothetical protein
MVWRPTAPTACLALTASDIIVERMKTVTAAKARQSLGTILARVLEGEDIGIVAPDSGRVIALRPAEICPEDRAALAYGLPKKEIQRAFHNINKTARREKAKQWDGTLKGLRS